MTNKKFFSSTLVAASLAGVVAFYACDNNDLTPAEDGKKLAIELCDCFANAPTDNAKSACITDFESKRDKWRDDADAKAFEDAFNLQIALCDNDPYQWRLSQLAITAAAEFCALATHPDAGNVMILAPLYALYDAELNSGNPAFLEPFFGALMACLPASDWILCTFRITAFCPEGKLTDDELAELAAEAVPEFCQYFADHPTADEISIQTSDVAKKYANYFPEQAFTVTLLQGLGATCSDNTPLWFICMMTGGADPRCP